MSEEHFLVTATRKALADTKEFLKHHKYQGTLDEVTKRYKNNHPIVARLNSLLDFLDLPGTKLTESDKKDLFLLAMEAKGILDLEFLDPHKKEINALSDVDRALLNQNIGDCDLQNLTPYEMYVLKRNDTSLGFFSQFLRSSRTFGFKVIFDDKLLTSESVQLENAMQLLLIAAGIHSTNIVPVQKNSLLYSDANELLLCARPITQVIEFKEL